MQCPNCHQPNYLSSEPCVYCGFSGDGALIEELVHIHWLLKEIPAWQDMELTSSSIFPRLKTIYTRRQRKLELDLGLRQASFTKEESEQSWKLVFRYNVLLDQLTRWRARGYLKAEAAQFFFSEYRQRRDEFLVHLVDWWQMTPPLTDHDRLDVVNALLALVARLRDANIFTRPDVADSLLTAIQKEKIRLEVALGLRHAEEMEPETGRKKQATVSQRQAVTKPEPDSSQPQPVPQSQVPFRERFWRMFLSKRTLNAMLFLGIFLIFAAAISFVIWGWKDFSAPLRVAIPAGFTALFFTLGWYVRKKTSLYNSGIALSAIASLLIPINFYTIYVNFDFPPNSWPEFWLVTSLLCLAAYLLVTYIIHNWLFGYLVGIAAGSIVLASIEVAHKFAWLSRDWYGGGLSVLAVAFVFVMHALSHQKGQSRWRVLIEPLRYLALLAVGVLMPLLLGWRVLDRTTYDTLHHAMTVTWFLGGCLFAWGAVQYHSRGLGMLAATALPIAVYMAQAALFDARAIASAWHAFGWACLAPLYIAFGYYLSHSHNAELSNENPSRSQGIGNIESTASLTPSKLFAPSSFIPHPSSFSLHPSSLDHARTANHWAIFLIIAATLWSLTDLSSGTAAACSHAILAGTVALAAFLWCRPGFVYPASILSFTTATFGMTELDLTIAQLCVGWASLAIVHIVLAYRLSRVARLDARTAPFCTDLPAAHPKRGWAITRYPAAFVTPLITAGFTIALLSLLPPLWPYDGDLFAYTLGNLLLLTIWSARLAHLDFWGFRPRLGTTDSLARFQWLAAFLLPMWLWVVHTNHQSLGMPLALTLAALSWGMVALGDTLASSRTVYRQPWRTVGLAVSVAACYTAFVVDLSGLAPAICLLSAGWLYFMDAHRQRVDYELIPAGLVTALGVVLTLRLYGFSVDVQAFGVAVLIALYFTWAMQAERRKFTYLPQDFFQRLYQTLYVLTLIALVQVYLRPLLAFSFSSHASWTDVMQRWGAATQLLLGVCYGFYAWHTYRDGWGHAAAWLGTAGAGMLVLAYSQGRGSSAAKAALIAIAYVLAERSLYWLRDMSQIARRLRAYARLAWSLYRRPLLVAGWTISVGTIGLALVRNLWLLGGGRTRQIWAIVGLSLITGLYAASARMFRKPRFVWFAAILLFAPWTILTNIGWFTLYRLTVPGFAFSWVMLAWMLFLVNVLVQRYAPDRYALPLRVVAHSVLPFALLWAIADAETSRVICGLAAAFYAFAAGRDWREGISARRPYLHLRFVYPAMALVPLWCIYLLAWYVPQSPHELYGLILLPFAPLGLWAGRWLRMANYKWRITNGESVPSHPSSFILQPSYGLPAYLPAYFSLIVATLLVAHIPGLLAVVLVYDALVLMASARVFRDAVWGYPAAGALALAVLIALGEGGVPHNRQGWWLVGLAAIYFALAWGLRRVQLKAYGFCHRSGKSSAVSRETAPCNQSGTPKHQQFFVDSNALRGYSAAPLAVGFVVLALSLPPSSQDQIGALWGYASAALLYALVAAWLKQPLLLWPACGLAVVPYIVSLQRSPIAPLYYGLWLFPGVMVALALAVRLDTRLGAWHDFPWARLRRWPVAFADRLFKWWALPLYVLGFGLGVTAPFLTAGHVDWSALYCLLLVFVFAWALWRFRLRGWLLALTVSAHLALALYLDYWAWWVEPAWAWTYFLPLTLVTVGAGLWLELQFKEGAPFAKLFNTNVTLSKAQGLRSIVQRFLALLGMTVTDDGIDFSLWRGWSRPLYLVAFVDMALAQVASVLYSNIEISTLLTVAHALVLVVLVSVWRSRWLPYVSVWLGGLAVFQWWVANFYEMTYGVAWLRLPVWCAWLAFAYGMGGYGLTLWQRYSQRQHLQSTERELPAWLLTWRRPLERTALETSGIALFLMFGTGLSVVVWLVKALIGWPFRNSVDLESVRMVVTVLSWVGLLYVTATVVYRRVRWSYVAFGMLLSSWMLYAFFIRQWQGLMRVQWYALPAGIYLLGISLMEWRQGHKVLARRLDYAAMLLLVASLFWQTLDLGWRYALMLGAEGFALVWWGSARRIRRFFYAGMVSVMLATIGQLINALQDVNQWIVFGLIGLLLFGGAALIERKLEEITAALRVVLEDWE